MDLNFSGDAAALSTEPSEAPTADDRLHWYYDSADEAMRDGSLVREESYVPYDQLTNSVGIAESNGQGMAFYGIQNDDTQLAVYYYRIRNGQYSQPYRIDKPVCADNPAYHYDLDDSVCERIADQYASQAMVQTEKNPLFLGLLEG